jgi:hypothetical protein
LKRFDEHPEDWYEMTDPEFTLPDLSTLSEMLPAVVNMSTVELTRFLERDRRLEWEKGDVEAVRLMEDLARIVRQIRTQTGWNVADVLHTIGCRKQGAHLAKEHLATALRLTYRLSDAVEEFSAMLSEPGSTGEICLQ